MHITTSSFYVKVSLESAVISIKTVSALVINQVNISKVIQIILTEFAVKVTRLPLTYFIFKHFNTGTVFSSIRIILQTFGAKYLNEVKPNLVVLTLFLKKLFVILIYSLILW